MFVDVQLIWNTSIDSPGAKFLRSRFRNLVTNKIASFLLIFYYKQFWLVCLLLAWKMASISLDRMRHSMNSPIFSVIFKRFSPNLFITFQLMQAYLLFKQLNPHVEVLDFLFKEGVFFHQPFKVLEFIPHFFDDRLTGDNYKKICIPTNQNFLKSGSLIPFGSSQRLWVFVER